MQQTTLLTVTFFVVMLSIPASAFAEHGKPAKTGLVKNIQVLEAGCHFSGPPCNGDGSNAGAILEGKVRIKGHGWPGWLGSKKATVTSSTSWDWSSFTAEHKCALVNTVPKMIARPAPSPGFFDTDATIIIDVPHKGKIYGKVRGGSVCELHDISGYTGVNEGMAAFEIDPLESTGKFYGATGAGSMRGTANQITGEILLSEIYLHLIRP